uniref:Reverse transcriptase Ty1/copia-type domain-containing protein n=1 Tax=Trichuris muris TaxID=70415 RepID=A0A5S6Q053_TRIMR
MLHSKNLPIFLWAEAVYTACHVLNRTGPTAVNGKSPVELWFKRGPACIDHLRVFGADCFVHVPKQRRHKWDKKSVPGRFTGYCDEKDGYRVWLPDEGRVVVSRDVIFKPEEIVPSTELCIKPTESTSDGLEVVLSKRCVEVGAEEWTSTKRKVEEDVNTEPPAEQEEAQSDPQPSRSKRLVTKPKKYLTDYVLSAEASFPTTFREAMESAEAVHWSKAMNEELCSLKENSVWSLVDLPPGKNVLNTRWVLRVKAKADGTADKYKARLVATGYMQRAGVDYDETFSPVARFDTVRALLSVAATERLKLVQFDVKTAFLYGTLKEEVYVKQPEGFEDGTGRVCKLNRSLYGLKQAPRCWNERLIKFLGEQSLKQATADPCLFTRYRDSNKLIVAVYVDDGIVAGSDTNELETFLTEMEKQFRITRGPLSSFLALGIQVLRDGSIFVSQEGYIRRMLKRFRLDEANAISTPIEVRGCLIDISEPLNEVPYREAVGALMFLMTATRPDIAFAVSIVSQFMDKPCAKSWLSVKRILRYLKGTAAYGLLYRGDDKKALECFSDADFAGDIATRRSQTGVISLYAGTAISWFSQKQKGVALSTTEAEYVAASEAAKELIWLKNLYDELAVVQPKPTLFVDNMGAVKLSKNPEFHKRTKHIAVRFHFVREKWKEGELDVQHIGGEHRKADILTKALAKPRFEALRCQLGLVTLSMKR